MKQDDKITNRDILKFLHNSMLYCADPVSKERIDTLAVWGSAAKEEFKHWVAGEEEIEIHLNAHELIFVLVSIAYDLQDEIMREENPRCHQKNQNDMKLVLKSCLT